MCLGAYVDLPLDEVIALLDGADVDDLLAAAMQASFGVDSDRVELHAVAPKRVTDHAALLSVTWHTADQRGRANDGAATVQLFVVQSGRDPVTELIVNLAVPLDDADSIAEHVHRALDELTARRLARVAA